MDEQLRIILIIIVSVSIFGLLVFVFVKNYIRNIVTRLAGHTVISAPSTCSSFLYNVHRNAPVGFLKQAGGLILHDWSQGFKSIRIEAQRGAGPFAF